MFLIESLAGGGAEKVLVTLLKHLDKTKFDITLCCVTRIGKYLDDLPSSVRFLYLLPNPDSLSGISLFLYKIKYHLIYKIPPKWAYRLFVPKGNDVEVAFLEGSATRILSGSTNSRARKLAWVHSDMKSFHWTASLYRNKEEEEAVYSAFDQIVTVSVSSRRVFQQELSGVRIPVRVLYNPVDREEILRQAAVEADVPEKKDAAFRIVSIGRLVPPKAFDRLLRIYRRLTGEGFRLELWILGDGPQRGMLQDDLVQNGLSDKVVLWGFQNNPYCFLAKCDLFVCSSLTEGFSTAATEAIILGIPIVTTACSGMDELLSGGCGIITDNDEEALYLGVKRVLEDRALFFRMKKAAQARSLDFAVEKRIREIEHVLLS